MEGNLAIANASIASAATNNFTPSDFTATDGTALTSSESVLVRTVLHENDITLNRTGDSNTDGTFEINEQIDARTGAGERHSDTLVTTQYAGVEVVNDAASSQEVTLIAEWVPSDMVFVESVSGLADASELVRTTGSRGSDESILEVVAGQSADLIRRHDANDDGTYELEATVDSFAAGTVVTETWLSSVDTSGRTNPAMQTALQNTSGGTGDYMLIGTIGER